MRPANALLEFVQDWEPRIRNILMWVGFAWVAFVSLAALLLAGINVLLDGPWWVHWIAVFVAILLFAPYVFVTILVMTVVKAWRAKVEAAARAERSFHAGFGSGPPP